MKKLKIRAKELKRIGYKDDSRIARVLKLVEENFKRDEKTEVMQLLSELLLNPKDFIKHEIFSELAYALTSGKATQNKKAGKTILHRSPLDFKVYGADGIDSETFEQMTTTMKIPVVVKGALMADAHVGYGLPIGGVVAAYNAVMPYGVGMDIGCRMCLSIYPDSPLILDKNREQLKNIIIENTRFGLSEFNDIGNHELMERKEFKEIDFLKSLQKLFYNQLGTSGHGNHFVNMGFLVVDENSAELGLQAGEYFAVLSHSGSRNFGARIANHYTDIARKKLGISGQGAQLAWLDLDSEEGQEYWLAMTLAGDYSSANHKIIHSKLSKALGSKPIKIFENHHNFAWREKLSDGRWMIVHRKGATPANIGDIGIIPGNMVSPAFVVSGKGNEESLNSASHGAGRQLSRNMAKKTLTSESMKKHLKKHDVTLIGGSTDESPDSYKDIFQVMEAQKELVNILARFYPKIVRMA
ncbi:MAG TPA: RtcB family protein [Bacteroidales bacterium]|nr:RtcB family protein [Bacteroidales bacterium]